MQRFNTLSLQVLVVLHEDNAMQRFCHLLIGTNFELFGRTCRRFPQKFEAAAIHIIEKSNTANVDRSCRIVTRLKLLSAVKVLKSAGGMKHHLNYFCRCRHQ
eukprot:scaffold33587_cov107-Skeletonema_dohrnii-CCMP3373.AAC.9